jgi:single-strand DNA-binding protein
MREGYNRVVLLGNVGKAPVLRGKMLAFSVATNESYFDSNAKERKTETAWHEVVTLGNQAESLSKLLQKGEPVFIEGRLRQREFTDRDGAKRRTVEIVTSRVVLLGGARPRSEGSSGGAPQSDASEDYSGDFGPDPF